MCCYLYRRSSRRVLLLVAMLAVNVALPACAAADRDPSRGLESNVPGHVIELEAGEYFILAPDSAPAGYLTFRLRQIGDAHKPWPRDTAKRHRDPTYDFHMIWLVRLDSAKTFGDLYIAERDRLPTPWAAVLGGVGFADPPRASNATIRVPSGTYALVCFVGSAREDRNRNHLLKGMIRRFTVTNGVNEVELPAPDATVIVNADSLSIPATIRPGSRFIAVRNEGVRPADLSIRQIEEGRSIQEVQSWAPRRLTPPPFRSLGGVVSVPPGGVLFTTILFEPGEYLFNDRHVVIR